MRCVAIRQGCWMEKKCFNSVRYLLLAQFVLTLPHTSQYLYAESCREGTPGGGGERRYGVIGR
jgi:hypothetical protein